LVVKPAQRPLVNLLPSVSSSMLLHGPSASKKRATEQAVEITSVALRKLRP
jgi:hypothetical protein